MGWVIKIDDKSRKMSKIKAFGGFWGRFSKPQKFEFYRWHSVFEAEKRFLGSEIEKISLLFFVSEPKYNCKGGDAYWYMEQSEEVKKKNISNVKEELQ